MSKTMEDVKHNIIECAECTREDMVEFKQEFMAELKTMLSPRRPHSSSSASSHRSSRHSKSNNDPVEHTRTRHGKDLQDRAMEREKSHHIERQVHKAFN